MKKIPEIVLTGGPCSGKTSALPYLVEKLDGLGVRALVVPEAATLLINGTSINPGKLAKEDSSAFLAFEAELVKLQLSLKERFQALAALEKDRPTVLIYDRAELDIAAYLPEGYLENFLEESHLKISQVRDGYDTVIHLVTAAKGAEWAYTLENNTARWELDPQMAIAADERTLMSWVGHHNLHTIDNSTDFATKLRRVLKLVLSTLGLEYPETRIQKKVLSKAIPPQVLLRASKVLLESVYLPSDIEEEVCLRKRTQNGSSYSLTTRRKEGSKELVKQQPLSFLEYSQLLHTQDHSRASVKKERYYLVENHNILVVDHVLEPVDKWIVEYSNEDLPVYISLDEGDNITTTSAISKIKTGS